MEFLSLSRRRSFARKVASDEERGETDVFAGYVLVNFITCLPPEIHVTLLLSHSKARAEMVGTENRFDLVTKPL